MKSKAKYSAIFPLIGVAGILYATFYALASSPLQTRTESPKVAPTTKFPHAIFGSGLIEANTRNIQVGSELSGTVKNLYVQEGSLVEEGTPLFQLDDRSARAEIATAESNLVVAKAREMEAEIHLADQQDQLSRIEKLKEGLVVTSDKVTRLRFAQRTAASRLSVAQASVREAEERVKASRVLLEKLTVLSPISGRVLKLDTRAGEYVKSGGDSPLVIGNDTPLHVRVSIDENDLWRFSQEAPAMGSIRGNRDIQFPLVFVRLEPYVVPKKTLNGSMSERVDSRVLEAVYQVDAKHLPIFIGQQVDVFIEEKKGTESNKNTASE